MLQSTRNNETGRKIKNGNERVMREFPFFRFKRNGMEKMRNVLVQRGARSSSNVWLEVGRRKVKIRGQCSSFGASAMGREQAGLCLGFRVPQIMVTTVVCES